MKKMRNFFFVLYSLIVIRREILGENINDYATNTIININDGVSKRDVENGRNTEPNTERNPAEAVFDLRMEKFLVREMLRTPEQNNDIRKVWSKLFKALYNRRNVEAIFIVAAEMKNDPNIEIIMAAMEAEGNIVVNVYSIDNRTWINDGSLGRRKIKRVVVFSKTVTNAWKNLLSIWNILGNESGQDSVLVLIESVTEKEARNFTKMAWDKLKYFYIPVARIQSDESTLKPSIAVTIYNPYQTSKHASDDSFRTIVLGLNSSYLDWKTISTHLENRAKDLQGYPLRVTMHEFGNLAIPVVDSNGTVVRYKGKEGEMVEQYARVMNFRPIYLDPRDGVHYGGQRENGSLSGAMKDLEEGFTDLNGNSRVIVFSLFPKSVFLKNVQQTKIVVVTPKAERSLAGIRTMLGALNTLAMQASILFLVIVILTWTAVRVKCRRNGRTAHVIYDTFIRTFMDCISIVNMMSIKMSNNTIEKCAFISVSIWALVVNSIYIGNTATKLTVKLGGELETLQDLEGSGLRVGYMSCTSDSLWMGRGVGTSGDSVRLRLSENQFLFHSLDEVTDTLTKFKNISFMCPDYLADSLIVEKYSEDGEDVINVLKEKVDYKYSSQAIPKWSPLLGAMDHVTDMLKEAGLMAHWEDEMKFFLSLKRMHRPPPRRAPGQHQSLSLVHLRYALFLWAGLILVSIFIFMAEIACHTIMLKVK